MSTILQNFMQIVFPASNCLLGYFCLFFGGFFISSTAKTPGRILTQNTSKDAVPHKDVHFEFAKTKVQLFTPFCPKNRHFAALFRRSKTPLTLDMY